MLPMDPTLIIVLSVVGVLVLALGVGMLLRRRGGASANEVMSFNCPGCRRKLKFTSRQAGHKGACPRCRTQIVFPSR